jgi:hypothetical protein
MGILRLGTGRHSLSKIFLALGCTALLALPAVAAQIRSARASANLRIRVRVLPTVATATPKPHQENTVGNVLYSIPLNDAPGLTRRITVRPMSSDESRMTLGSRQFGKPAPAMLETLTIVGE